MNPTPPRFATRCLWPTVCNESGVRRTFPAISYAMFNDAVLTHCVSTASLNMAYDMAGNVRRSRFRRVQKTRQPFVRLSSNRCQPGSVGTSGHVLKSMLPLWARNCHLQSAGEAGRPRSPSPGPSTSSVRCIRTSQNGPTAPGPPPRRWMEIEDHPADEGNVSRVDVEISVTFLSKCTPEQCSVTLLCSPD